MHVEMGPTVAAPLGDELGGMEAEFADRTRGITRQRTTWILVAVLTCLGAALALSTLTDRGLWLDEAFTKGVAMTPTDRFVDDLAHNGGNMSLYLLFMRAWLAVDGSDFWLRLPSVIFGAACIPAFFLLARRFVSIPNAVAGSALVALSAPLLHHAQEARSYSLTTLLVILLWLAAIHVAEHPTRTALLRFIAISAAVTYSHMIGILFIGTAMLWLLSVRRREAVIAGLWTGFLVAPQAILAIGPQAHEPGWVQATTFQGLLNTLQYLTGTHTTSFAVLVGSIWLWTALRAHRASHERSVIALAWVVVPTVSLLALSLASPMFVPRYLVMAVPGAIMLLCLFADVAPRVGPAVLVAVLILSLPGLPDTLRRTGPNWESATRILIEQSSRDEVVLFKDSRQLLEHYWNEYGRPTRMPMPLSQPASWGAMQRLYPFDADHAIAALDGRSGAWLVLRQDKLNGGKADVAEEIERRWPLTGSWEFSDGRIVIRHYGGSP